MEIVEFLTTCLAEDERIARAATWCDDAASWHAEPSPFGARDNGQRWYIEDAMDDGVVTHVDPQASDDEGVARHIAEHDPARVLREIEAKRGIVARYEFACHEAAALDISEEEREKRIASAAAFQSCVLLIAAVYETRPGYAEAIASAE